MNAHTVFLTGSAGFCGHHLATYLSRQGNDVTGFDRSEKPCTDCTRTYTGDVNDTAILQNSLRETYPGTVFHLAALTDARLGYQQLHTVNTLGTFSLLESVREACPERILVITSSSAVYGHASPDSLPIRETQPFHPTNPYAVSKIAQEMIAYQHFAQHDLRVIRTRAFNLTGPGESAHFVTSAFARQIAEIEANLRKPVIRVGNLESVRDFTDVRDVVRAYSLLAEKGKPGEVYNVCSGKGTSIKNLLQILLELSTQPDIAVQVDPSRLQPADVPIQIGDAGKLQALTGWTPTIPLRQTLEDVLNYWRTHTHEELT
jgi:GDP-4-dehydro-6-deoxy-D-mannose reductase